MALDADDIARLYASHARGLVAYFARRTLQELPAESRDALRLRVLEERSCPEVAAELGIAEPAARARVSRALRGLAASLEGERKAA
jgi:DNA-directed RNA polymerase specialized sigma24 family protein